MAETGRLGFKRGKPRPDYLPWLYLLSSMFKTRLPWNPEKKLCALCVSSFHLIRLEEGKMDFPVYLSSSVSPLLQLSQEPAPQSLLAPPVKPAGYRAPRAIPLRQVPSGSPGAQHPQDAIDDGAMVFARPSGPWLLRCQQRLQPLPLNRRSSPLFPLPSPLHPTQFNPAS